MVKRPIINTRDEPHADPKRFRRFHVIVGDTNMAEVATYLKVGTMALVMAMVEDGREVSGVDLDNPVRSIKDVSRDLTLKKKIKLSRGVQWRSLEIQRAYLETAEIHFSGSKDPITRDLLQRWRDVLDKLDEDPMQLPRELDWVIKKELIESYMTRKGCNWNDPRVSMMNLQYHNVVRDKGLFFSLERDGYVERLISPDRLTDAQEGPPKETRAYFRGACLKKFPKEIDAASWSTLLFDIGNTSIKKVPLLDPWKGGEKLVGPIIKEANSVETLLDMMAT